MTLSQLLNALNEAGITLTVEGEQLKFSAPKGAMTPALLAQIKASKSQLIALFSSTKHESGNVAQPDNTFVEALSFAQQRLVFMADTLGASHAYNVPNVYNISGDLDVAKLQSCLNRLLSIHPELSKGFVKAQGQYVARHHQLQQWPLTVTKVANETERALTIAESAKQSFSLDQGPLLSAVLMQQADKVYTLVLTIHHLVTDGFSQSLLWRQLWQLYQDDNIDLSSAYDYQDFIAWQNAWLTSPGYHQQLQFWTDYLEGAPPLLDMPLDHKRPERANYEGRLFTFDVPSALCHSLEQTALKFNTTSYCVALSAFFLLLNRYSGQDDICIGTAVANRKSDNWQDVVGLFSNVVALRQSIDNELGLDQFITKVRDNVLDAMEYQDFPFERLVEHLQPERSLSYSPVFQVMFLYEQDDSLTDVCGLKLQQQSCDLGVSKFDLTFTLKRTKEGLMAGVEYNTNIFDVESIEKLVARYQHILSFICQSPTQQVRSVSLLNQQEQKHLLSMGRGQSVKVDSSLVHEAILQRPSKVGQQVALSDGRSVMTYDQLAEQVDITARHLRLAGVKVGDRVGIFLQRSNWVVVAMLGAMKAGAAYVPVDTQFPRQRQEMIISDADLKVLLVESDGPLVPTHKDVDVSVIDTMVETATLPALEQHTEQPELAYVMFTSGSSGRPKGVKVKHVNVLNLFAGLNAQFSQQQSTTPSVFKALTSISFDISVLELLWTLSAGFTVIIEQDHFAMLDNARQKSVSSQSLDKLQKLQLGLFYFAADGDDQDDKYQLLREGAKFADNHGFSSIWIPERHFHRFGGLYPNPSVAGAMIAGITENLHIRSGSVVLPLHDPIRVAEEWSMVDNMSGGRVGLSIATGWHFNDFVLAPDNFAERHKKTGEYIETLKSLWAGNAISAKNGLGEMIDVNIYPKPLQKELPLWITAAANPETFKMAGASGANVLTHLLGQSFTELNEKIAIYRQARADAGFDPASGIVSLMLHTYLHQDEKVAFERVEKPFKDYLRTSANLLGGVAKENGINLENEMDTVIDVAYKRYAKTSALFGSIDSCLPVLADCAEAGVNELALLIDFGVPKHDVIESFAQLHKLQQLITHTLAAPDEQAQQQATHLQCTPSYAQLLLDSEMLNDDLVGLEAFFLGGEPLPSALAKQLQQQTQGRIYNMYGPTETTVWSAISEVKGETVEIGLPMANQHFYILDENLNLLPPGIVGQLYIGGAGVSAGYWQRDDLTEQMFKPDPYSGDGAKMYATGDLMKRLPSGQLIFIARKDNQVKVRGYRIELDEIANTLSQHSAVHQATALVHKDAQNNPLILAYVMPVEGAHPLSDDVTEQLNSLLSKTLPSYMQPNRLFSLKAFPHTPNGKLDQKALPRELTATKRKLVPAANDVERRLMALWSQLLKKDNFGIKDSFFELGGHSLMLVALQEAIDKEFNQSIDVVDFFNYPTIHALAKRLRQSEQPATKTNDSQVKARQRADKQRAMQQRRTRNKR